MKKGRGCIAILLLASLMAGCSATRAASGTDGAVNAQGKQEAGFAPIWFYGGGETQVDLDGDGETETVVIKVEYGENANSWELTVRGNNGTESKERIDDVGMIGSTGIVDVNTDDREIEIVTSVNVASGNYQTVFFRYDGKSIEKSEAISGDLQRIDGGEIIIDSTVNVLGSWWATRTYEMKENFTFAPKQGELWKIKSGVQDFLVTKKALPVRMDQDGGTVASTLEAGTKLVPVSTDGATIVYFTVSDGRSGFIECVIDSNQEISIAGEAESKWFAQLAYAQ